MGLVITEQYLGPLAKVIRRINSKLEEPLVIITNFVEYNRHMDTLANIDKILFDDGLYFGSSCVINNIGYYGGLSEEEAKTFDDLLSKARGEIQRRMNVFEQDQLTILKKK